MRPIAVALASLASLAAVACQNPSQKSQTASIVPIKNAKPYAGPVLMCSANGIHLQASLSDLDAGKVSARAMELGSRAIQNVPGNVTRETIDGLPSFNLDFIPPVANKSLKVTVTRDTNGTFALKTRDAYPDADLCQIAPNISATEQISLLNEWMSNRYLFVSNDPQNNVVSPFNLLSAWKTEMGVSPNPNVPNPAERFVPVPKGKLADTVARCVFLTESDPGFTKNFVSAREKKNLDSEYLAGLMEIQERTNNALNIYEVKQFLFDNSSYYGANDCSLVIEIPTEKTWFFVHSTATRSID